LRLAAEPDGIARQERERRDRSKLLPRFLELLLRERQIGLQLGQRVLLAEGLRDALDRLRHDAAARSRAWNADHVGDELLRVEDRENGFPEVSVGRGPPRTQVEAKERHLARDERLDLHVIRLRARKFRWRLEI